MLHINDLVFRIGGRVLLDGASATVAAGHRAGLVGRNGTGKTTLFRLITGEAHADGGTITVSGGATIGTVAQEAPSGEAGLLQTVLAADKERNALLDEAETAADPGRIADIHHRLADIDSHTAESRAGAILQGLGFDAAAQARPVGDFSGGWRMRVALAAALFARPDLLLLDEPTNHLDLEATLWLENYLAKWPGTLLVISHDRTLLNTVVDEIIHLQGGRLTRYAGGYDRFERTRRERLVLESKMRMKQEAERRHIQSFVDRFRYKATKARQAQSRIKMLARMEPIASVMEERTVTFRFPDPQPLAPPILSLEDVAAGYAADTPVLTGLNLRIDMDDRIALLGANGNGKSTLVKLLAGRLQPLSGSLRRSGKLRAGYFAQHQTDELDDAGTPFEHMARLLEDKKQAYVRARLGAFGFEQQRADTRVENLSGGEKARLLFVLMSVHAPHIMLLDEPTNHLDVDARESLVQAMNDYQGAIILVSHDPHLIELTCDRLWLVAGGACDPFDGDLADYRRRLLSRRREGNEKTSQEENNAGARQNGKESNRKKARRDRAQARAQNAGLRRSVKAAEKHMDSLASRIEALEARLTDPAVYEGPTAALMELQVKLSDLKSQLAQSEQAWLESQARLEEAG